MGITADGAKTAALDAISPVVVLKGSSQYARMYPDLVTITPTTPTPIPTKATPVPTPSIAARQIDPYAQGERWEKQWYKHTAMTVVNPFAETILKKPLEFGVVTYDHKFLNSYTWWSDQDGQYYREIPHPGYKFLFVWVHEEVFGDPKTHIPNIPGFNMDAFSAQVGKTLYHNDTTYNPVNRILDFDTKADYYKFSRTSTFGYTRIFLGYMTGYGGWIAQENYDIYTGQGNAWDGYIVYQVPAYATDNDTLLVGNFGAYGNAFWRFNIYAGN